VPEAERTISINQPPSAVFPVIADGRKATLWRPAVLDVALVSGSGLGAIYRQGVRGPGRQRIDADYEITAFEPNVRLAFRTVAGPVRPTGEYELEGIGGATALTFRLRADLSGWKQLLIRGAVQATMNAEMAALDRLRDLLEA
jgi:Polyketide cyclase / dehydrase and lipid transport